MTDEKTRQLLEEIEFLEGQLVELKKHPFIKINPKDPTQQQWKTSQRRETGLLKLRG